MHAVNSAEVPLSLSQIRNVEIYRCQPFDHLLEQMQAGGFVVSDDYRRLREDLPGIDKIYWQPWRTLIAAEAADGMVSAYSVIHHGLHHMLWRIAPERSKGMSRFNLLGECVACAGNIYFCLLYYHTAGLSHEYVQSQLGVYKHEAERLGHDLLPDLNEWLQSPFETFRAATLQLFDLCLWLLKMVERGDTEPSDLSRAVRAKLSQLSLWPLLAAYDVNNFVLHTLYHCGPERSQQDRDGVQRALELLIAASSFEEFLKLLQQHHRPMPRDLGKAAMPAV
jgi:hypothetical protein